MFGAGEAARRPGGPPQDITPNHRALALRFGLFDRFFVNSEASPDGHNWSTAAFSTDYVDKAFRWAYSGRGRSYDYEGFNRQPDLDGRELPAGLQLPASAEQLAAFMRRFVPYLNGWRDAAEPDSLYLWDAAARAGLSYRTLRRVRRHDLGRRRGGVQPRGSPRRTRMCRPRSRPSRPSRRSRRHHNRAVPGVRLWTPDAMTAASYARRAPVEHADGSARLDRSRQTRAFAARRGSAPGSRSSAGHVADLEAGRGDHLPALSILHLPNDHTVGITPGLPTPQFHMADNDYALGRLVEAVSHSAVLEEHGRSSSSKTMRRTARITWTRTGRPLLVISAYNRRGALVHELHNTVSLIRTMELLLGIPPMNQLDRGRRADDDLPGRSRTSSPYIARLPEVAPDNLVYAAPKSARERYWVDQTAQDGAHHAGRRQPARC